MASQEHQELALFIKAVHHSLRKEYRKLGHEQAWKNHCTQKDVLEKYADTMHLLATKYWEKSHETLLTPSNNRIHWVVDICVKYFLSGGRQAEICREIKKQRSVNAESAADVIEICCGPASDVPTEKLKLLDVGSCYNPFSQFPLFEVTAIDLAPATHDVWQCDFLHASILDCKQQDLPVEQIITRNEIPANFFDIVVFSLFLEYLPCPRERYNCCQKAYRALRPEGLLFIITPDSRHATANAPIMKHWRLALGKMGFHRIHYEKLPHLHCMAYRKCVDQSLPQQWAHKIMVKLPDSLLIEDVLCIPQDNNICESDDDDEDMCPSERTDVDSVLLAEMFSELPGI